MDMKKLKYFTSFLGVYDYYGNHMISERHTNWIKNNCKGKWNLSTHQPDIIEVPRVKLKKKPDNYPIFFKIIFSFSRKKDCQNFCNHFGFAY